MPKGDAEWTKRGEGTYTSDEYDSVSDLPRGKTKVSITLRIANVYVAPWLMLFLPGLYRNFIFDPSDFRWFAVPITTCKTCIRNRNFLALGRLTHC